MNVIAINGSPRKNWNTATLLQEVLKGAQKSGAETELIDLYTLNFKGCISCFACKRKEGKHGFCAMKDDLTPVLEKIIGADALIIGSPIYFGTISSGMQAFLERLLFSNMLYNKEYTQLFPKKIPVRVIYTMNISEEVFKNTGVENDLAGMESRLVRAFGSLEKLCSFETWQFDDYSEYEADMFDASERKRIREERFPIDCLNAYNIGSKLPLL